MFLVVNKVLWKVANTLSEVSNVPEKQNHISRTKTLLRNTNKSVNTFRDNVFSVHYSKEAERK